MAIAGSAVHTYWVSLDALGALVTTDAGAAQRSVCLDVDEALDAFTQGVKSVRLAGNDVWLLRNMLKEHQEAQHE
jgi:hypothetical protein